MNRLQLTNVIVAVVAAIALPLFVGQPAEARWHHYHHRYYGGGYGYVYPYGGGYHRYHHRHVAYVHVGHRGWR